MRIRHNVAADWKEYAEMEFPLRLLLGNLYQHTELFEEVLREGPNTVLEVGVGTGSMSTFLSWLGREVTALDNDPDVLARAEQNNHEFGGRHIDYVIGDAFALPFAPDSFDLAFHQGLLEHFSDAEIEAVLEEQLRVAPVVVFSVPNRAYGCQDHGDERLMDRGAWERILSRFKVAASYDYWVGGRTLRSPLRRREMYLAKVRR